MHCIDYQIALSHITEASETPHQAKQWFIVQQQHAGEIARVRLALRSLPYVTSYELPFRLLLIRAPQAIEKLRGELTIYSRRVEINDSKRGVLYSLDADVAAPEAFHYTRKFTVFRSGAEGGTENGSVRHSVSFQYYTHKRNDTCCNSSISTQH